MKRMALAVVATVAGLVSLLSFKSHAHPVASGSALPAANLPGSSASTTSPSTGSTKRSATHRRASSTRSSAPSSSSSSAAPTRRSYLGSAVTTQYGVVQVKVTVSGKKILSVSFAQLTAFDPQSQAINSYAAPILLRETLSAQSAQVDTVSGATYTSAGYQQSLQSALDAAGIR